MNHVCLWKPKHHSVRGQDSLLPFPCLQIPRVYNTGLMVVRGSQRLCEQRHHQALHLLRVRGACYVPNTQHSARHIVAGRKPRVPVASVKAESPPSGRRHASPPRPVGKRQLKGRSILGAAQDEGQVSAQHLRGALLPWTPDNVLKRRPRPAPPSLSARSHHPWPDLEC